jgi:hypothetical protein
MSKNLDKKGTGLINWKNFLMYLVFASCISPSSSQVSQMEENLKTVGNSDRIMISHESFMKCDIPWFEQSLSKVTKDAETKIKLKQFIFDLHKNDMVSDLSKR